MVVSMYLLNIKYTQVHTVINDNNAIIIVEITESFLTK